MILLDGTTLAARRASLIAERAAEVRRRRGHAPRLLIVAFGDEHGRVSHVERKVRACAAVGVEALPLVLRPGTDTRAAVLQIQAAVDGESLDGVFVQFPFPAAIDGDALAAAIPVHLDVDIMTPGRVAQFMEHEEALPPVTVTAGLLLLESHGVSVAARRGIVVADELPFSLMFRLALERHGAEMDALVPPDHAELERRVGEAELVVVAAARSGLVPSSALTPGTIAVDVGYFNEDAHGDIDVSGGTDHLAALSPVPGGIGPMTVSALIDRVVLFAEWS
ncbi:MAG: tetrahydrofolate dehydrogenase/cyclohydrolase catalytic domain-containing protein [Gemmatimonadota bacterium]